MALDITDRDPIGSDKATSPPLLGTPEEALAAADRVVTDIVQGSAERERTGAVLIPQLHVAAEAGLLGIAVPAEHGGPGLPASTVVEVLRRLSRADGAVGQLLLSHFVITQAIAGLGTQVPAPRIYAEVLAGAQLGNATAERGTKHALDRRTTVTQQGDQWLLNGTKYYATGALGAAWIAVAAVIERRDGDTATVFVRPDQPGVTLDLDKWSAFGQRGTASGEVRLENVVVDAELVIDEAPRRTRSPVRRAFSVRSIRRCTPRSTSGSPGPHSKTAPNSSAPGRGRGRRHSTPESSAPMRNRTSCAGSVS